MLYYKQVQRDAKDFIDEYLDEFKEDLGDWGGQTDDPSFYQWMDYDGKLHEHTESVYYDYDPTEICDNSDNVETDTGLWSGVTDWRQIRDAQAFWTLKLDLWFAIEEILKDEELIPEEQIQ